MGFMKGSSLCYLLKKLAYTHGDSRYLFDEVTFSLNPGERILISGYSGCGKSTLAILLSGLKESGKGQVLLNGSLIEPSDVGFLFKILICNFVWILWRMSCILF